jgi:hypothetical protein
MLCKVWIRVIRVILVLTDLGVLFTSGQHPNAVSPCYLDYARRCDESPCLSTYLILRLNDALSVLVFSSLYHETHQSCFCGGSQAPTCCALVCSSLVYVEGV